MEYNKGEKFGYVLIGVILVMICAAVFSQPPIAQDIRYHDFADTREMWGIPNFWNVVSNCFFLIVGARGLYRVGKKRIAGTSGPAYLIFFTGIALVAFGSGYYHLSPDNLSLVWDRLPMTFGFMALFSIIISEYVSPKVGRMMLLPLVLAGIASVVYWYLGETTGEGDLRFYALIQFSPVALIPVILLCFKSPYSGSYGYWWLIIAYVTAKLCEHYDAEIFNLLGVISGHSIKHVVAALGVYVLLSAYEKRVTNAKHV